MTAIIRFWLDNPVLTKELRVRMRGARAYWILTGYLAILSFMLFMQYSQWWNTAQVRGGGLSMGSKVGQGFFYYIIITQAFLVAFITPAITAGAITMEKEQRTLELLEMTRLSRGSIVAGKLLSAISFVALLLVSSLPLTSICFFLGGVSPEQVIYWYLLLLAISFVTATVGLVWSTIARTTAAAVVLTYCSLLAPWLLSGVLGLLGAIGSNQGNPYNPIYVTMMVMGLFGAYSPEMASFSASPAGALLRAWDMRHFYGMTLPIWLAPVLTYAILGITMAAVAAARLETFPERKARLLRCLVAAFVAQQLFFFYGARFASIASGGAFGAMTGAFPLLYSLTYPILLLLFITPVFATGEIRPVEARNFTGYLLAGWTPRGLSRGRPSSGLPYLLLLAAVAIGLYCLSFVFVGQAAGVKTGLGVGTTSAQTGAPVLSRLPDGTVIATPAGAPAPPAGSTEHGANLLRISVALGTTIVGLFSVGLLLSVMIRNRWVSMALLYVVLLGIFVAPSIARMGYNTQENKKAPSIYMNLYYLNPVMAVSEVTDTPDHFWSDMNLMFARTPMWQVCTVGWLFISGICIILTLPFLTRIAAGQSLPYEDMAASV